jgi:rod shape-determining protein MreC
MSAGNRHRPALVLASLLLAAGILPEGPFDLRVRMAGLFTPLAAVADLTGMGREGSDEVAAARWREEREALRAEVEALRRENRELRLSQGLALSSPGAGFDAVSATVMTRDLHRGVRNSVTVDRGAADGVRRDMAALSGGCLAGLVVETATGHARVRLLDDPGMRIAVEVIGKTEAGEPRRSDGVLVGGGGGRLMLRLLPLGSVAEGDLVVTASTGPVRGVPAGVAVGRIASFRDLPRDGLAEAVVVAAADLKRPSLLMLVGRSEDRMPEGGR